MWSPYGKRRDPLRRGGSRRNDNVERPDKLNAWTATMELEVRTAVEEAEGDSPVRVIVLTGAGRGFCAGADMSLLGAVAKQGLSDQVRERALRSTGRKPGEHVRADFEKKYSYFLGIKKPVIAAVNGPEGPFCRP
jgi:enoyl-CoA hydratase/carnithine racemase